MTEFQLKTEYIALDQLLKLMNLAESGGMAHAMIDQGEVSVNTEVESRRRRKLYKGDVVACRGSLITLR